MERVERFTRLVQQPTHRFLMRAFLPSERRDCLMRPAAAQHLAGRWAGKEAVIKALSALGYGGVTWQQIEIVRQPTGLPQVRWHEAQAPVAISVSVSHSREVALAFAIAHELA